jgi:hypothetical protein
MLVLMQFRQVVVGNAFVQLLDGVLVVVNRLLPFGMNMGMEVLVRMGVLVFVAVDNPILVPVLVAVAVRVNVRVGVLVFDLSGHRSDLLLNG